MPVDTVTIRERLLLHLNRFPEYSPETIYNIPFDLTQDGIASVLGISRAHASLELKKLRESQRVCEWLAHIKSSGSKRKAYSLLPGGKQEAELVRSRFESDGISVEGLLDMKRCDPNIMWSSLNDEDRTTFGLACTFREPVLRRTLPDTTTGVIPSDFEGMVRISDDVRRKYLDIVDDTERRSWHSLAADWYVNNNGENQEKLFHLSSSGRNNEAAKLLIKNANMFLENPNEDLLNTVKSMEIPPKFRESALEIQATISLDCMDVENATFCADRLDEYCSRNADVIRAEVFILTNEPETAYRIANQSYSEIRTPLLALVTAKALFLMKEYENADSFITNAVKDMMECGDVTCIDRILMLKAGVAYAQGNKDRCSSYLNKALRSCRKDIYRSKIKDLLSKIESGDTDLDFT